MNGVSPEEVEDFIAQNELEEKAANALRTVGAPIQRAVIDQGSLQGCRSTSAGCLGRIHKLQTSGQAATLLQQQRQQRQQQQHSNSLIDYGSGADPAYNKLVSEEELESFIIENDLNEKAIAALRSVGSAIQRHVLDQGTLQGCRSTSAGCLGRIKTGQATSLVGLMAPSKQPSTAYRGGAQISVASSVMMDPNEVEAFIYENMLNEKATNALRTVKPEIQRQVIDLGSLASCRDASAGCLGRIRDLQRRGSSMQDTLSQQAPPPSSEEVEQFIADNELHERAASALRSVGPVVQRQVLDLGPLNGCRSPSAGCLGRIQKAQTGQLHSTTALSPSDMEGIAHEVEWFIQDNGLNIKAQNALRSVGPVVQRKVLKLGSLVSCRDRSAGCLGRIRDAQSGKPPAGQAAANHWAKSQMQQQQQFGAHGGGGWGGNSWNSQGNTATMTSSNQRNLNRGSIAGSRFHAGGVMGNGGNNKGGNIRNIGIIGGGMGYLPY